MAPIKAWAFHSLGVQICISKVTKNQDQGSIVQERNGRSIHFCGVFLFCLMKKYYCQFLSFEEAAFHNVCDLEASQKITTKQEKKESWKLLLKEEVSFPAMKNNYGLTCRSFFFFCTEAIL